jgi:hypothetical protein
VMFRTICMSAPVRGNEMTACAADARVFDPLAFRRADYCNAANAGAWVRRSGSCGKDDERPSQPALSSLLLLRIAEASGRRAEAHQRGSSDFSIGTGPTLGDRARRAPALRGDPELIKFVSDAASRPRSKTRSRGTGMSTPSTASLLCAGGRENGIGHSGPECLCYARRRLVAGGRRSTPRSQPRGSARQSMPPRRAARLPDPRDRFRVTAQLLPTSPSAIVRWLVSGPSKTRPVSGAR